MSAEQLAVIAAVILSLLFSYVPGLSNWYSVLDSVKKRLVMAVLLLAVSSGAFALSCGKVLLIITCDRAGVIGLIQVLIAALVANQATFLISPRR